MLNTNHNLLFKATILALCVISFVHIFLFPLYEQDASRHFLKTFADIEQSFCAANVAKQRRQRRASHCPQYGIVTTAQGGRLGNHMWAYASVWALARRTGLEPFLPRCIRSQLDRAFEALSVPTFEEIAHCPVDAAAFVKDISAWNYTNQSILIPLYVFKYEWVLTWRQDIVQEFAIRRKYVDRAQRVLHLLNATAGHVFVGVHVRRTDYLAYLGRVRPDVKTANAAFFNDAMRYFERKFGLVQFVFVSDDPRWCRKHFAMKKNVYVASNGRNSAGMDLAVLAACNHTIFDYGTFGEWGAILAGGETIYYNTSRGASVWRLMKNWHAF